MDIGAWLKKLRRERDQETVELAERGIAPEDEVRETEERIAAQHHEGGGPGDGTA